jgi:hypothetical protein
VFNDIKTNKSVSDSLLRALCKCVKPAVPVVSNNEAGAVGEAVEKTEVEEGDEVVDKEKLKEEIESIKSLLHVAALRKFWPAKRLDELKKDSMPRRNNGPKQHGGMNNNGGNNWKMNQHKPSNNNYNNHNNNQ